MRQTKAIVGTAASLAGLAGLLWMVSRRGEAPRVEPLAAAEGPATASTHSLLHPAEERKGRSVMEGVGEETSTQPQQRELVSGLWSLTVLVLREETGMPMPGIEVRWQPRSQLLFPSEVLDSFAFLSQETRRTDSEGIVVVPDVDDGIVVWSASPQGFGMLTIGPGTRRDLYELFVRSNEPLVVRTVDPEGVSVAGVVLEAEVHEVSFPDSEMLVVLDETTSDQNGRATFVNARADAGLAKDGLMFVRVKHSPSYALVLDSRQWPVGEVVLRVPGSGGLRACVVGNGSGRFEDVRLSSLEGEAGAGIDVRLPLQRWSRCVEFRGLPLGKAFDVHLEGGPSQRVEGPRFAGEVVRVDFDAEAVPEERRPWLTGKLVAPDGEPLANAGYHFHADGSTYTGKQRTNGRGGFRIEIDQEQDTPVSEEARLRLVVPGRGTAQVQYGLPLRPGRNDVGTVVLVEHATIASILVRGEEGEPIERVKVTARESGSSIPLEVRASSGGRYEVLGDDALGTFQLRIVADGYLLYESRCPVGSRDLPVVLARTAMLAGKLLLDPGIDVELLSIHLPGVGRVGRNRIEPDGSFRLQFGSQEARPTCLEVRVHGEGVPLFVQPMVAGVAPEIDLRGRLHGFLMQVRDGDGALGSGTLLRTDPTAADNSRMSFDGLIRLVASTPAIDLSIELSSGVRKDFAGVRSGDVLVLD